MPCCSSFRVLIRFDQYRHSTVHRFGVGMKSSKSIIFVPRLVIAPVSKSFGFRQAFAFEYSMVTDPGLAVLLRQTSDCSSTGNRLLATMTRPRRLEFEGALYHIRLRGDRRETIYDSDDAGRSGLLALLGDTCNSCNWVCHAGCLTVNYCHRLIAAPESESGASYAPAYLVYTLGSSPGSLQRYPEMATSAKRMLGINADRPSSQCC